MNEAEINEIPRKAFMDQLFGEVAIAIEQARVIKSRFSGGATKRDAEIIEQILMPVAERLALEGHHAKERFETLLATSTLQGIGLHSNQWHSLKKRERNL